MPHGRCKGDHLVPHIVVTYLALDQTFGWLVIKVYSLGTVPILCCAVSQGSAKSYYYGAAWRCDRGMDLATSDQPPRGHVHDRPIHLGGALLLCGIAKRSCLSNFRFHQKPRISRSALLAKMFDHQGNSKHSFKDPFKDPFKEGGHVSAARASEPVSSSPTICPSGQRPD